MHICASQFSKFPGEACPRTPLEGARAGPRRDRVAITSFGVLEFHAPRDSNPGSATGCILLISHCPCYALSLCSTVESAGQKTEPECVWSEIESQNLQESDKNGNRRSMGKMNSCLARKQKGVEDCLFLVCLGFSNSSDGKNGEKQPTLHF